ncbi:MFS transporter [Massilia forsythiae]|uniref:MFS transporter n=1 Tax=Massilia forsythiae TaxID=2728020 RepID=A0A7Z2W0V8_9BURK|nr:MFS transporter [Massilia forsythiae]QJE02375.1 MFS transporter [Massilia forsythiae]
MKNALLIATACLLALLSTTGASLPYPILPPLFVHGAADGFTNFLGLPPKLLFALALMVNPVGLLIGTSVLGSLSDRFGRRPLLLGTTAGAAIGHTLTAWALARGSYPLFLLARFGTGLLEGQSAIVRAMLAERLQGPIRNHALSWLNGALTLGWLFGPLLAGFTVGFGVTVPFYIAAAALALGALLVLLALERRPQAAGPSWWRVARERHAFNLLRHPGLRTLFGVQLAYTCGVTAFYEFYPLWLVEVGHYGARSIALVNVAMCALMSFSALFAGRQSSAEPLGRAACLAGGVALAIASLGAGHLWIGIAGIMAFGLPHAFYNAVVQAWAADRFGAGHGQGAVMGLLSTTFCLANILMAAAGAVLTLFDTRLVLVLGALLTAWAATRMRAWSRESLPAAAPQAE